MTSEFWALLGVVVGAILGALAQIVADRLRRGHENAILLRNERREAYGEFLAAVTTSLGPFAASRPAFQEALEGRQPNEFSRETLSNYGEAANRLTIALSRVQLTAPDDTVAAASTVQAAIMRFMFRDEEGMVEDLVKGQQEFARLAKRDLALARSRDRDGTSGGTTPAAT